MKAHSSIPTKVQTTDIPTSTMIIGSNKGGGNSDVKALNRHDGIVLGGSVTSPVRTPDADGINRLPGRQDGKIL